MTAILLIDNGSKRPEATLALRQLAKALGSSIGQVVNPVSLQHADTIPAEKLDGIPAEAFTYFLSKQLENGEKDFIILPLFFGISRALTVFIPQQVSILENTWGKFNIKLADVLYPFSGEALLVDILEENINNYLNNTNAQHKNIILVDHGSPQPKVTAVRAHIAAELQKRFSDREYQISEASMERRPGKEYDFNGPLLERSLNELASRKTGGAIVAQLFLLPGRHAGTGGDIQTICQTAQRNHPDFDIRITPLVSENKKVVSILESRFQSLINYHQ